MNRFSSPDGSAQLGMEPPAISGLTTNEAARRLAEYGPNEIEVGKRISVLSRILAQLREPFNLVLMGACVLTLVTNDWTNASIIALVVTINSAVGVIQEVRADRAVTALAAMSAPAVRARRNGVEVSLPSAEIVPGDIVLLAEGDIVPADGEVVEQSSFLVDESALTGESIPVGHVARSDENSGGVVSAGTVVVKGRAVVRIQSTGANSALGQIAAMLDSKPESTPLQQRMADLSRVLAIIAVSLSTVVFTLGILRGESFESMLITAISLTVAAIPESLPAVVTLALALGASRMAARKAIVRRLPAVETLGSVGVLATDKTGTLTGARMYVSELWTPKRRVTVLGNGYEPVGRLMSEGTELDLESSPDVAELLRAGVLCNDAALIPPEGDEVNWSGVGDPTEVALLTAGGKIGLSRSGLETELPRIAERPFESGLKRMTTVHDCAGEHSGGQADKSKGETLFIIKGSPEVLHSIHGEGEFSSTWREALAEAERLANLGYRVIAVASGRSGSADPLTFVPMRLLGLIAIIDPATPAARASIHACQTAGIVPILVTGDHPATARAIAMDVGIINNDDPAEEDLVVTGQQMSDGYVPDLTIPRVFARTTPAQKLDIIQAWKNRGESIAMMGDGVNDGPALRRADVGVAMGHRGTEVARQAADLILADDNLDTMVVAIEEGRRVYDNIRRFLIFGLAGGAAEIAIMLLGPFIGLTVPLLAAQILWINLLTHGITGVAIGAEPGELNAMRRRPRPPDESVLGDGLWLRILVCAFFIVLATAGVGLWAESTGRPWQSMVFLSLTSLQLGVALGLRSRLFTRENLSMPFAIVLSLALAVAGLYVPILRELLGTQPLTTFEVFIGIVIGIVGWAVARLTGYFHKAD